MRNLRDIFLYDETDSMNLELDVVRECIMDGNFGSAFNHVKGLVREELGWLPKDNSKRFLYRFVGFPPTRRGKDISENEIIKDIRDGRITLSNPMTFNDPMDPLIRVWAEEQSLRRRSEHDFEIMAKLINAAMNSFRIGCLAHEKESTLWGLEPPLSPYQNTLMWGHYAKSHTGVCIKYRITPEMLDAHTDSERILFLGDVRYRHRKELGDDISLDNSLLAKSNSWEYENETRMIYFTTLRKDLRYRNGRNRNYVPLTGFEVQEVYMGYKIKDDYKQAIKDAISGTNISLYQMSFDRNDITRLVANRVNSNITG